MADNENDSYYAILGDVFILVSCILAAIQNTFEEYLLKNHDIEPLELIGFEGMFGILNVCIVLPVLYMIPCVNTQMCSGGSVENVYSAITEAL